MEANFSNDQPVYILLKTHKSVTVSFLLALIFGPLGLLYTSIKGGLIMLAVSLLIIFFTWSIGLIITWPACLVWAVKAAGNSTEHLRVK